jgi:hypothetical protein
MKSNFFIWGENFQPSPGVAQNHFRNFLCLKNHNQLGKQCLSMKLSCSDHGVDFNCIENLILKYIRSLVNAQE